MSLIRRMRKRNVKFLCHITKIEGLENMTLIEPR